MTDKEKAIVMAYTGRCMLTEDKFQIFHEYKEKSKADFIALCADESEGEE